MEAKSTAEALELLLRPNGELIGEVKAGAHPDIRTVTREVFEELLQALKDLGATPAPADAKYPGTWFTLPEGQGRVGLRVSKKNGATLDVNALNFSTRTKIHYSN
jgi:hypothetical protein